MRAMTNFKELTGEPSEKMKEMETWIQENKETYQTIE